MKKNLAICLLLFVAAGTTMAQVSFRFDEKAGINMSYIRGDKESTDLLLGFQGSFGVRAKFQDAISVSTGLGVITRGYQSIEKVQIPAIGQPNPLLVDTDVTARAVYLNVPLHVGYTVYDGGGIFLTPHAGVYAAYGFAEKLSEKVVDNVNADAVLPKRNYFGKAESEFKDFDWGLGIGVEIEFQKVIVDLFFDHGLYDISRKTGTKVYNSSFGLSLGYRF